MLYLVVVGLSLTYRFKASAISALIENIEAIVIAHFLGG